MRKAGAAVLAVLLVLPLCFGCGQNTASGGQNGDIVVAFVPKITGNAFFESANAGAQQYAKEQGFTIDYTGNAIADVSKQLAIVDSLIKRKVDAICISSLDATALNEGLRRAMQAGIKVVTWDSDVDGSARSLMVSQGTPEQLGRMLVDMGAKSLAARDKQPGQDTIRYVWHYSQATVKDQNSWQAAGEEYIKATYPNWVNVRPVNYYSNQDEALAITTGEQILQWHSDIDLIICNDSTALPGQAQAAKNLGLTQNDVTITGFASPNAMREYCKEGIVSRWGLWDCKIQGALGCYLAYYLALGNEVKVGDFIDVPQIGLVEVMPNTVLDPDAYTAEDSGTVLLPTRCEFTIDNVYDYDF